LSPETIVGIALLFAAMAEIVTGLFVVGPRIPEEGRRRLVVGALLASGVAMAIFGGLFLGGAIGLGG
jgi:uncharacterized BrkB/YihY/UPF0761 family membrane protein